MSDDTTPSPEAEQSEAPTEATPAATQATPPATAATTGENVVAKKPVNALKREKDRVGAKLRRLKKKLAESKSQEELKELEAELGGAATADGEQAPAGEPAAELSKQEPLEPGQLPGWPKPSEVEAQLPSAMKLWGEAKKHLQATRYGACLEVQRHQVPGEKEGEVVEVVVDPVAILGKGTAPLLAQVLGKVAAMTPATAALVSVATVFGPTAAKHAVELGRELLKKK